jgi:hypothetical protein
MGLTATTLGVRRQGNALLFGVTEKPLTAAASGSKEGAK